ncbi:helix-turn-helix domain-containing protein [Streptomyces sp. NPDC058773]|uniref:helix-turn-helix domain-containing protein n=1 Tax=Streptomyces sp. NPDC058773 TaxID=3346632 RepID=UPI0036B718DC
MHVHDLLQLDALGLTLLWGDGPALTQEISGVTAAGHEAPAGCLRPGELVLSGLEWWTPDDGRARTDRFVAALRSAGATVLLAGAKARGAVPDDLVESCRAHGVVLIAVPAHTTFRALTEAATAAIPHRRGDPDGRPSGPDELPERTVEADQATQHQGVADALVALIAAGPADGAALDAALRACGLPASGPYRVVVATTVGEECGGASSVPVAALRPSSGEPFAAGRLPGGEAVAVIRADLDPASAPTRAPDAERRSSLAELWPALYADRPQTALHAGVSAPVRDPEGLNSALDQARYALAAARAQSPEAGRVTTVEDLGTLGALLSGVPAEVRTAFRSRVLGPLAHSGGSHRMLLETLEAFLAHHGSWARTAAALQLHVNSVHYRIQRIELLTGRDLSRLEHKLDLQAALLCR